MERSGIPIYMDLLDLLAENDLDLEANITYPIFLRANLIPACIADSLKSPKN